jgi:hypothetical protein
MHRRWDAWRDMEEPQDILDHDEGTIISSSLILSQRCVTVPVISTSTV